MVSAEEPLRSSLVGYWLIRENCNWTSVLRSREWTAIRHLLSSIVPATKSSEHHVGGGQRTEKASSRMTVSMRAKGDYAMHSARFCDHMPLYVNSERLLWYPLWMTAVG